MRATTTMPPPRRNLRSWCGGECNAATPDCAGPIRNLTSAGDEEAKAAVAVTRRRGKRRANRKTRTRTIRPPPMVGAVLASPIAMPPLFYAAKYRGILFEELLAAAAYRRTPPTATWTANGPQKRARAPLCRATTPAPASIPFRLIKVLLLRT